MTKKAIRTRIPGKPKPAGNKLVRAFKRSGSVYGRKVWL